MQVFKSFFQISKKRLKSTIIYLCIYMFIMFLYTFSGNRNIEDNFRTSSLTVYVQDEDQSESSKALTEYLKTLHNVSTEYLDEERLTDRLYYRYLDFCLTIPKGFEQNLLAGESSDLCTNIAIPGSTVGTFVEHQITQYIQSLQMYTISGYSAAEAVEATNRNLSNLPEVTMLAKNSAPSTELVASYYQYMPYVLFLVLLVGMAPIINIQNDTNIKARTLVSSMSATNRTLQLAAACATYALLIWALFQGLGMLILGKAYFSQKTLLCIANSFAFLLFGTAITLMFSTFSPSENVVNILANSLGLGMSFLCGVFVPQSMLSDQVLSVAKFLPTYWYISNNNMIAGLSKMAYNTNYYLQCIGIQLLFAGAAFAITMCLSKMNKQAR